MPFWQHISRLIDRPMIWYSSPLSVEYQNPQLTSYRSRRGSLSSNSLNHNKRITLIITAGNCFWMIVTIDLRKVRKSFCNQNMMITKFILFNLDSCFGAYVFYNVNFNVILYIYSNKLAGFCIINCLRFYISVFPSKDQNPT